MDQIRKLEKEDIEEIISLRICLQNFDKKYMDVQKIVLEEDQLQNKTRLYLQNNLNQTLYMFGYFKEELLISICGFYIHTQFPTYTNPLGLVGHMASVYTREEYRKMGYQKQVFAYALTYAEKMGITKFELDSGNECAIKMYRQFGFSLSTYIYQRRI